MCGDKKTNNEDTILSGIQNAFHTLEQQENFNFCTLTVTIKT